MHRDVRRNRVATATILGIVSAAVLFQQTTSAVCVACLLHHWGVSNGSCCQAEQDDLPSGPSASSPQRSCCEATRSSPLAQPDASCCPGGDEGGSSSGRCACFKSGAARAVASPSIVLPGSMDEAPPFVSIATAPASPLLAVSQRSVRNLDLPPPSCPPFVRFHRLLI